MISVEYIPDFSDRMTFEHDGEEACRVECQITPDEYVASVVDGSCLHGSEDTDELK